MTSGYGYYKTILIDPPFFIGYYVTQCTHPLCKQSSSININLIEKLY